jgi:L-fuconolactonase
VIVDAHVHPVADFGEPYKMKTGPKSTWVRSMPARQILDEMETAGIARAILVQASGAYGFDNAYATDSAAASPDRFASVCAVDPLSADSLSALSYWVKQRGAAGLRLHSRAAGVIFDDLRVRQLLQRAGALAVPVCVLTEYSGVAALRTLLETFPEIPIALDHMAFAPLYDGVGKPASRVLFDIARLPNVFLKVTSVNLCPAVGAASAKDFLRRVVDSFGATRLMWGSNFPASGSRSLPELLELARDALSFLDDKDQRLVFGETALRLWPRSANSGADVVTKSVSDTI